MRRLAERVAVVTGAGQGNGSAIARGLAEAGAIIACLDYDADRLNDTCKTIAGDGGRAIGVRVDVTDEQAMQAAAEQVLVQLGSAAILVNNAGVLTRSPIDDVLSRATWKKTFDVNVDGVINSILAFLPQLKATRGSIINIGSIQSFVALENSAAYTASKGAVLQLTKALAVEFARFGIRVNGIAPGLMATPMTEVTRADPARLEPFLRRTPLKRVGEPSELVGPAVFLASQMSSYVTGVMLPVDGGYLAA